MQGVQGNFKVTDYDYNLSYALCLSIQTPEKGRFRMAIPVSKELGPVQLATLADDLRRLADFIERNNGA